MGCHLRLLGCKQTLGAPHLGVQSKEEADMVAELIVGASHDDGEGWMHKCCKVFLKMLTLDEHLLRRIWPSTDLKGCQKIPSSRFVIKQRS